jgi:hypothetical protein
VWCLKLQLDENSTDGNSFLLFAVAERAESSHYKHPKQSKMLPDILKALKLNRSSSSSGAKAASRVPPAQEVELAGVSARASFGKWSQLAISVLAGGYIVCVASMPAGGIKLYLSNFERELQATGMQVWALVVLERTMFWRALLANPWPKARLLSLLH